MEKKDKVGSINKIFDAKLIVLLILTVIGVIIYSNTFYTPFAFDDHGIIVDSTIIKNNDVFLKVLTPRYIGLISFALNYKWGKLDTFGYHLVNIIIHLANAFLVYLLLRQASGLTGNKTIAEYSAQLSFFIALLFLVHPVQTQAVTYIVQRFTSLAAFFVLVSLLSYLQFRQSNPQKYAYYLISLLAALCAFKTKENTAALPLLLLTIEMLFFGNSTDTKKRRALYLIPFLIIAIVIPLSFININKPVSELMGELKEKSYETPTVTRLEYLFTEQKVIVTYLRLLVLPVKQSIDYSFPLSRSLFEINTLLSSVFLMFLFVCGVVAGKKYPLITFGILWFFIFQLVESTIIPITDVIFEHRVYLSSVGFITAFISMLYYFLRKSPISFIRSLLVVVAIILAIATYMRNAVWKDEVTIWRDAASKYPMNLRCHLNYGSALGEAGQHEEAIKELEQVFRTDPDNINYYYIKGHINLAYSYLQKGLYENALKEYDIVLQIDPGYVKAYGLIASIYLQMGNADEALKILLKGQQINDSDSMVNSMLGSLNCQRGDFVGGVNYFTRVLAKEPDYLNGHLYLAFCYFQFNRMEDARTHFLKSVELKPDFSDPYFYIAQTYDKDGNYPKAREFYEKFISASNANNPLVPVAQSRLQQLMQY